MRIREWWFITHENEDGAASGTCAQEEGAGSQSGGRCSGTDVGGRTVRDGAASNAGGC